MTDIQLRVVHGDAADTPGDVLVLKYAQGLHGLDRAVAGLLSLGDADLPPENQRRLVPAGGAVRAASVLFLGVPPLRSFSYEEIRIFGRRAVIEAATVLPQASEICLTLHGPNYGLDETEAFESELAGIIDAVTENLAGAALRTVTFVEKDRRRADQMRGLLDSTIPGGTLRTGAAPSDAGVSPDATERMAGVGYNSDAKPYVFVALPFAPEFDDVYAFGITPPVHDSHLLVERMDQRSFTGDVVAHMRDRIAGARLVVADVTGANPNVYLEIGFAWGNSIPTVLVCRAVDELKFDVRGHRCLTYTTIVELQGKLRTEIASLLSA